MMGIGHSINLKTHKTNDFETNNVNSKR